MNTKCTDMQQQLSEFLDGVLPEADAAEVRAHLRECAACRLALKQLRGTVEAVNDLPTVAAPKSVHSAVIEEIIAQPAFGRPRIVRLCLRVGPIAALFAAVLGVTIMQGENMGPSGGVGRGLFSRAPRGTMVAEEDFATNACCDAGPPSDVSGDHGYSGAPRAEAARDMKVSFARAAEEAAEESLAEPDRAVVAGGDAAESGQAKGDAGGGEAGGPEVAAMRAGGGVRLSGVAGNLREGGVEPNQVLVIQTDDEDQARKEILDDEVAKQFIVTNGSVTAEDGVVLRVPTKDYDAVMRRLAEGAPTADKHELKIITHADGTQDEVLERKVDWYTAFRDGVVAGRRPQRSAVMSYANSGPREGLDVQLEAGESRARADDPAKAEGIDSTNDEEEAPVHAEEARAVRPSFVSILIRFLPLASLEAEVQRDKAGVDANEKANQSAPEGSTLPAPAEEPAQ